KNNKKNKNKNKLDNFKFIKSIHKKQKDNYSINKGQTHNKNKYQTTITEWTIKGEVNLFNINNAIKDLTYKITEGYPDNVLLQIILKNKRDGNEPDTKLLPKSKINDMLTNWVNYLIDYKDIDIEDVIFKVIAIKIPCGTGRKNNTIINLDVKRCIIQIKNNDTICLARAIVVALSLHKEELQKVFKDKLAPDEIKEINRKKQIETQIHKGIISEIGRAHV